MGILHAIRIQKLVTDARRAHAQGDGTFGASIDIDPRGMARIRNPMKKIRKEIDLVVRSVEDVGWECVGVHEFMYSINMEFVRAG
ncbi:hypothetical protein G3I19_07075 [Streptomyces sp. SID10853]|uniref:hypothetical protein n=1 Tax=Streptomyces sp. SID10853 TaxID=2706028 RepID=UPI0013BF9D9A|nr:hypothetical protein [Streptomyces sp. SID10853]NDZ78290.1 hypothetical protein [Streptomyces sp. SID10853]